MNILIVICLSLAAISQASEWTEEEDVLVLTKENFEAALEEFGTLLVEFYAPWCGHCKALAPEYSKAAKELKDENTRIRLAKVDATAESELSEQYEVKGYPTIKFFRTGKLTVDYTAGRQSYDIVTWLKKKTGPPAVNIATVDDLKKFTDNIEVVFVGFFPDQSSITAQTFLEVAEETDDLPFGITSAPAVFAEYKVRSDALVAFKQYDDRRADLTAGFTNESMRSFISKHRLPLVVEFTQVSAQKIFGGDIKVHVLLFISKTATNFQTTVDVLRKVAPDFLGQLLMVYVDVDDDDNLRVLEFFGLTPEECPTLRYVIMGDNMVKYKPDWTEFTISNVKTFVQAAIDGTLKPHYLTQPLPSDWNAHPVKVLTGVNFAQVAYDSNKNVFVEFYAPWCGHCKALAPIWEELAEKYADQSDLIIAKMDATANELADFKVENFPTLKYFLKGRDEVIDYTGDRNLEAFVHFLDSGGKEMFETPEEETEDQEEEAHEEL